MFATNPNVLHQQLSTTNCSQVKANLKYPTTALEIYIAWSSFQSLPSRSLDGLMSEAR